MAGADVAALFFMSCQKSSSCSYVTATTHLPLLLTVHGRDYDREGRDRRACLCGRRVEQGLEKLVDDAWGYRSYDDCL